MSISATTILKHYSCFLIVAGLFYGKSFIMPLCIGGVLATLFLPFCNWLQNKKIPKAIAIGMCLLILILIIAGIVTLVSWQIGELTNDVDLIKQKIAETGAYIQKYILHNLVFRQGSK